MARRIICYLSLILMVMTARPLYADPRWSRLDTPNFIILGAQGEPSLREVGRQFEGFREALTRILSATVTATPVPTIVVVFPDDKSFLPFEPVFEGKVVDAGGLFVPRSHVNYILLGPNRGGDNLRAVFHEYSHLLINNVVPDLPLWLNEGLADYYSSFEVASSGRAVIFGRAIPGHYNELNANGWMPLSTLLATTRTSPAYNENARRGVFYAESWLLVHMMLHGQPERRPAFARYIRDLSAGKPAGDAWDHAFGGDDIYKALQQYSRRLTITARQYTLSDQIARAPGVVVSLAPVDLETTLGEVLVGLQKPAPAIERFNRALALQPTSVRAAVDLANAAGRVPEVAHAPDPSDWLLDYMIGATLIEHGQALDRGSLDVARTVLARAAAAKPDLPNVQVLFAMADEFATPGAPAILDALKKAHAAAPVRDDYSMMLARALARDGDFAGARSILGEVMARPSFPDSRDDALAIMRQVVAAEAGKKKGQRPTDAWAAGQAVDSAPPVSETQAMMTFRAVQTGEQRIEGVLERIDCVTKHVEFTVKLPDRVGHFQAPSFEAVELISYRDDLRGVVSCGPRQQPERVYLTWRAGALDGTAIAIEFLPDAR